MQRSRKELKILAKRALLGNYGTVVGSFLLGYLALFALVIPMLIIMFMMMFAGMAGGTSGTGMATAAVAFLVIWYFLMLAAGMLFMMGITRICYQFCAGQVGRLGDLLYALKNHPIRFMGLSLLLLLIIMLGSVPGFLIMICGMMVVKGGAGILLYLVGMVLSLVLGMVLMLRYSMAGFILIEDPTRKVGECIRLSKDMMDGNKMRLFKQHISFIGIFMLGYLTLGVGMLWIMPYVISTNIYFYLSVKEEKYSTVTAAYENTVIR